MKKMITLLTPVMAMLAALVLMASPAGAQDACSLPEGAEINMRNTIDEPPDGEVTFPGAFGLADDAFDETATVSYTAVEFPTILAQTGTPAGDFGGLYEVDMSATGVSYATLPAADDPFWGPIYGVFPAEKYDRYYMTFSEPHGITGATSTNPNTGLRVDSPTVFVIEIGSAAGGYDMNPDTAWELTFTCAAAAAPELAVTGVDSAVMAVVAATMIAGGAVAVRQSRRFG